jgi:hypothetical protein
MKGALDGNGCAHTLHSTLKFRHDTIAGAAENPPTMLRHEVADSGVVGGKRRKGFFLVGGNEATIAGDVAGKDDCKLALHGDGTPAAFARAIRN